MKHPRRNSLRSPASDQLVFSHPGPARTRSWWFACLAAGCLAAGSFTPALAQGTYYVDAASSSCSSSGPGTELQPYCTISAALSAHHGAGTTILVKPGIYHEQVSMSASLLAGDPITFRAVGGPVVVDGADDYSSLFQWAEYAGDVWLASSVTWSPKQVFADGARLSNDSTVTNPAHLPPGTFHWVSGTGLYVNAGGGSPASHLAEVGHRNYGFFISGHSGVTIDGFMVTHGESRGIQLTNSCTNITVSHNVVNFSFGYGIQAVGGSGDLIASNIVSDNFNHGIGLTNNASGGVTGSTVEDNESFRNARPTERAANGIFLFGSPNNVIRRNRLHDNQDSGLQINGGSNDCLAYLNQSWNNGDHGYDHLHSTGTIHIGDVAYGNYKDGFSIEGSATGTQLSDCIAIENGLTTNEFDLWVDDLSSAGFASNYNIFWNSTSQPPVKYMSTLYSSVAEYGTASGQDPQTLQADPLFANPAAGDFHLQSGSPAIDSGDSGAPSWPASDAAGSLRLDDTDVSNTGSGSIDFSDRGAYEFRPISYTPPSASLLVSPVSGTAPLTVTADASGSSDPDGTIVSYQFDFGDGAVAGPQPEPTASHTYYAVGVWTASVTVTDDGGHENTATAPVSVARVNQPPNGTINTPSKDVTITVGQSVKFTGTATDPEGDLPLAFLWDFGGGAPNQTVEDPGAVVFSSPGKFTVTFTVTDHLGLADPTPATRHITVNCPTTKPHAVLAVTPRAGLAPLAVTADASGSTDCSGTIVSYRFNFGDGTIVGPQAEATATHTYAAGNWTARVVVTDNHGARDSTSLAVLSGSVCADNQVGNSSFETDLAGWSGVTGASLSQVTGGLGGDFSCQVQGPANTQTFGLTDNPNWVTAAPAANSVYTIKAWVRSASALGQVKIMAREIFVGGSVGGWKNSTAIKLSPAWNQLALKFTATKAGSAVDIQVVDKPARAGEVFQTDVISICAGATGAALADAEEVADEDVSEPALETQDLAPSLAPNPVADRGILRFTTHGSGPLQVMLFDIAGRRVRTLVDTPDAPGGMHEFAIDHHGDDGARLRAGVYFYRIHSVGGTTSGHFLLMR